MPLKTFINLSIFLGGMAWFVFYFFRMFVNVIALLVCIILERLDDNLKNKEVK